MLRQGTCILHIKHCLRQDLAIHPNISHCDLGLHGGIGVSQTSRSCFQKFCKGCLIWEKQVCVYKDSMYVEIKHFPWCSCWNQPDMAGKNIQEKPVKFPS